MGEMHVLVGSGKCQLKQGNILCGFVEVAPQMPGPRYYLGLWRKRMHLSLLITNRDVIMTRRAVQKQDYPVLNNLFIYQARESQPSPVSAENVIYEAFVVMGEQMWGFSALLAWRKGK